MIEFIAHAAAVCALICAAILCIGMYIDLRRAAAEIEDDEE